VGSISNEATNARVRGHKNVRQHTEDSQPSGSVPARRQQRQNHGHAVDVDQRLDKQTMDELIK
jgi:hypothetical protein